MSFRAVFVAIVIAFALVLGAFLINHRRPAAETGQPNVQLVRATGKCAECHLNQQYSVVHEYELSKHAQKNVNCLDCHQPQQGQKSVEHKGFTITAHITPANCRQCHQQIYDEFLRSRHAATSWAAVYGEKGLSPEQVEFAERYQPGGVKRPPHPFVNLEGNSAMISGCEQCHSVGRPNEDGTIGTCTACHARHSASVEVARQPRTCAQCHMGPDHSQIEIYEESKHGVLFNAQEHLLNLRADPKQLTTRDMFVPTCATCHMSGLNGLKVTHDPSERLSYFLAAAVTQRRPDFERREAAMRQVCSQCHGPAVIDRVYKQGAEVVASTNAKVQEAQALMDSLHKEGALSGPPFSNPIDFINFDLWHYDGRTSKHGAFMGGADFVQWHGNYPMLSRMVEMKSIAADLRAKHGHAAK